MPLREGLAAFLKNKKLRAWVIATASCAIFLIIDQSIKLYIISHGKWFTINSGIALSIFEGFVWLAWVLNMIGVIIFVMIVYEAMQLYRGGMPFIIAIVMGGVSAGIISNIVDRIRFGGVIDYIRLWSLPRANLADYMIFMGICYLLFVLWSGSRKKNQDNRFYNNGKR